MRSFAILIIRGYQNLISPILPPSQCRYFPSCSEYAIEAVRKHGTAAGLWLAFKRILRCHPYSKSGGLDPVP